MPDSFVIPMAAEIATEVTHPAGALLDSAGDPVLDEAGNPIFEETL